MAYKRRVGVGRANNDATKYTKKAEEMKAVSIASAIETVQKLETKLAEFAKKHKHDIQTDAAFRAKFLEMCGPLGVDPLSSDKSIWTKLGLDIGEFYYELAVKVAEVCMASRSRNGGIISIKEVQHILAQRGTKFQSLNNTTATSSTVNKKGAGMNRNKYSEEDIITAISKLSKLGSGFRTVSVGHKIMIISVPTELDNDHMDVMKIAQDGEGRVTLAAVLRDTSWNEQRSTRALNLLLSEGMAWLDVHRGERSYWFPSMWKEGLDVI